MKRKFIDLEVWSAHIHVFWDCTSEDVMNALYEIDCWDHLVDSFESLEDSEGACVASGPMVAIWVKGSVSSIAGMGTLAHEIFHAVYGLLKDKGMVISDDSEEAYAYLTGYLFSTIMKADWSKRKK